MDLTNAYFKKVRYLLENVFIYVGNEKPFEVASPMISNIYVEKDYDNTILPYFQVTVNVPNWLYRNMQRNPTNIRMSLTLKYGLFDEQIAGRSVVWNTEITGKYYVIMPNSNVSGNEDRQISVEKADKTYGKGYMYNEYAMVDLLLLNETYYLNLNKAINAIFSSCTPVDALTYVLNQGGYSNILLSPPTQNRSYSDFKLIPIPLIEQIKRICFEYNLHPNGTIIFFDLNRGYLIDKQTKCTAYYTNEYRTVNLLSLSGDNEKTSAISGMYIDGKNKTYNVIIPEGSYKFENKSNDTTIRNIQVIDAASGNVSTTNGGKFGSNTVTYVYNGGANTASQIAKKINENQSILTLNSNSLIMSALTPNKTFTVSISNTKVNATNVNGQYRISKYVMNLSAEGEYFLPITSAMFIK